MVYRALNTASYYLDRVCRVCAASFFITMIVLVIFQVIARYVFRAVPVWTEEAARYCMVWGGLLGATIAFRADVDPRLIPPPVSGPRWKIMTATYLRVMAVVIFLGPVLYHSDRFLIRTWRRSTQALGISSMWITMAVPLCIAIIFFHLLVRIVNPMHRSGQ